MLTARDAAESRINGLEIGADDYVAKPFEPRELSLRIANILKRAQPPAPRRRPRIVRFGPFVFHLGRGELRRGDEVVRLTDREREMLRRAGGAARRDRAAHGARRQRRLGRTSARSTCRSTGCAARSSAIPTNPLIVQTVRGIGYRLVVSP